jgi:predicted GTPase
MSLYTNEKKNIIVFGNTGAGKSTLISRMCETEVPIGHGLSSMTETIDCYQSQSGNSWIDTPGLLDSK